MYFNSLGQKSEEILFYVPSEISKSEMLKLDVCLLCVIRPTGPGGAIKGGGAAGAAAGGAQDLLP